MRKTLKQILTACLLAGAARAQSPEMARLEKALAGQWNTVEIVQFGKPAPESQGRSGVSHAYLAAGGTVLVSEGHTVGPIGGDLLWFTTVWWDPEIARYRFLTCFKASDGSGCKLRGTGRWIGDMFVNEYEGRENGKLTKMRDVWTDITPTSHTLTEEHDDGHGAMKPYVVSHDTKIQ